MRLGESAAPSCPAVAPGAAACGSEVLAWTGRRRRLAGGLAAELEHGGAQHWWLAAAIGAKPGFHPSTVDGKDVMGSAPPDRPGDGMRPIDLDQDFHELT